MVTRPVKIINDLFYIPQTQDKHNSMRNNYQCKTVAQEQLDFLKEILWTLGTKKLKPGEWKRLARHWQFSEAHIKAIEHQYTG